MRGFLAVLLVFLATSASSEVLRGRALVIDGDTLEVRGQRVRIEGIDAFEMAQICVKPDGKRWKCGAAGKSFVERLTRGKTVRCEGMQHDTYGRLIADCTVGDTNIGAAEVKAGLALAFVKYSRTYVQQERTARAGGLGVWNGSFTAPWDYRSGKWQVAAQEAPDPGCPIKGNISRSGKRIYHLPYWRWYERTRIDPAAGERWFCSEAEAVAAGWRASASR